MSCHLYEDHRVIDDTTLLKISFQMRIISILLPHVETVATDLMNQVSINILTVVTDDADHGGYEIQL